MVGEALERVGLRNHLACCFTSLELGASKPDSRFFENVAAALGIPPGNLMAVGNDLQKDIVPAKEVGMNTVLVSPCLELSADDNADLVVPSLIQLAELFLDGITGNSPVNPGRVRAPASPNAVGRPAFSIRPYTHEAPGPANADPGTSNRDGRMGLRAQLYRPL
jgi:hypothetical protein